jgi:hypothetical protein
MRRWPVLFALSALTDCMTCVAFPPPPPLHPPPADKGAGGGQATGPGRRRCRGRHRPGHPGGGHRRRPGCWRRYPGEGRAGGHAAGGNEGGRHWWVAGGWRCPPTTHGGFSRQQRPSSAGWAGCCSACCAAGPRDLPLAAAVSACCPLRGRFDCWASPSPLPSGASYPAVDTGNRLRGLSLARLLLPNLLLPAPAGIGAPTAAATAGAPGMAPALYTEQRLAGPGMLGGVQGAEAVGLAPAGHYGTGGDGGGGLPAPASCTMRGSLVACCCCCCCCCCCYASPAC